MTATSRNHSHMPVMKDRTGSRERRQRHDRVAFALREPRRATGDHRLGRLLSWSGPGQVGEEDVQISLGHRCPCLGHPALMLCWSSRPAHQCSPSSAITASRSAVPTVRCSPSRRQIRPPQRFRRPWRPSAVNALARLVIPGDPPASRLGGPRHPGASGRT